jgi:hypothetical protein
MIYATIQSQLISRHANIAMLHLKSSPAQPRKLLTRKPAALPLAIFHAFPDFLVAPGVHRTRILRCRAATGTGEATALASEATPQGIYANIDFRFDVKDVCQLTVSGSLGKTG